MNATINNLVIDNTAFAHGFNINILQTRHPDLKLFVSTSIYEEALNNPKSKQIVQISQDQGLLRIQDPQKDAIEKVQDVAFQTGDFATLSNPDLSILALAYDLIQLFPHETTVLMSDDYAVQNVSSVIGIPIYNLFKSGIQKVITWEIYCPRCHKVFKTRKLQSKCPSCDTQLKHRPKKSENK